MINPMLILIAGLIVIFVIYVIIIFNGLVMLKNNIRKSWANIDVLLNQRYNELPNLIDSVKGYMKHEKEVLNELTKARSELNSASSKEDKAKLNNKISNDIKTLFAVSENYPKLQANENFLKLQERISQIENEIADRREFYNDSVTLYNTRIESFPDLCIARMFKYVKEEPFSATLEEKKRVKAKV